MNVTTIQHTTCTLVGTLRQSTMNVAGRKFKQLLFCFLLSLFSCALSAQAASVDFNLLTIQPPETTQGQSATLLPNGEWLLIGGWESRDISAKAWRTDGIQHHQLNVELAFPRAWHTATLLPDGSVLILGGLDTAGEIVTQVERFDPEKQTIEMVSDLDLIPRARHTANLMTDGRMLIVGGVGEGSLPLHEAEILDPLSGKVDPYPIFVLSAREGHKATLLPSEPVLIWGGVDTEGRPVEGAEAFDPSSDTILALDGDNTDILPELPISEVQPAIEAIVPESGAQQVSTDSLIVLRFSKPMRVQTLNQDTVTLIGPGGQSADIQVVPAEGGLLLFLTPSEELFPESQYTLFLDGVTDEKGGTLPFSAFGFSTAPLLGASVDLESSETERVSPEEGRSSPNVVPPKKVVAKNDGVWIPNSVNRKGDWRYKGKSAKTPQMISLQAPVGVTALAGQVLQLNGAPLENVSLTIDERTTFSDETGRFLLNDLPAGRQVLTIEGESASFAGKRYGRFEVGVDIIQGTTNTLPYTIWMPKLATGHSASIPSPTTSETIITTPHIPGLELHIPSDAVIRDHNGNLVTEVGITAIPVDRPPFPLPKNAPVPIYFTVQPGSAYIQSLSANGEQGARLIYPNYTQERPGTRMSFWQYDPDEKGWYVYGKGTVTDDGTQVVPDDGVVVYEFTGAMISVPDLAPDEIPPDPCGKDGDPVDCSSGVFIHESTDLFVKDVVPLRLTRTYRAEDTRSRSFGIGASHPYDIFLVGSTGEWTYQELILPDGARIYYERTSPGTDYIDAVYMHSSSPTKYHGSKIAWNNNGYGGWDLTLKNGTVLFFPEAMDATALGQGSVRSITDRHGNTVVIERDLNHDLVKVTSPNGRWISFTNDTERRITQAQDNLGRTVSYSYDNKGRLAQVTHVDGGVESYTYNNSHNMLKVTRPDGEVMVSNAYDNKGRVKKQTLADGGVYQFSYTTNAQNQITETEVTDPRGVKRQLTFDANGYVLTDIRALGAPEQQTVTIERDPATNLILSKTDTLGRKTAYGYDTNGNVTSITRLADTPDAVTESFTYTSDFNQLATYTDALGNTKTYSYDTVGNLTQVTDPLGHSTQIGYNSSGQVTSITDPNGHITTMSYLLGDLQSVTNPLGHSIQYWTDNGGRVGSQTDALGNVTLYDFDTKDRLTKITDAQLNVTELTYDLTGNLTSLTDPRGGITTYTYDGKDRLVSRTDPLGALETFEYDGKDNLVQRTDRNDKISLLTYDDRNRLITLESGGTKNKNKINGFDLTTSYTYDAEGRLTQVDHSDSGIISYTYDGLDRVTSEITPEGSVSYSYDNAGRRTSMTVAGQPSVIYDYDVANRLTAITQGSDSVQFSYDAANRRSSLTLPNGIVASYSYDDASQLTGISYTLNSLPVGDLSYSYDPEGRRISMGGTLAGNDLPTPMVASYNLANQMSQFGSTTFSYDANGNLLDDGNNSYTWNSRNQLAALTGTSTASFLYDAFGRRVGKTINGTTTGFLYDGDDPVQELDGTTPTANLLTGLGIDEYFLRSDINGSRTFLRDALGSIRALTDESGNLDTEYRYQPFGQVTETGTASNNSFQYTGRENDNTGLYFYRTRYYHPELRRFISEDPIGFRGGLNIYTYVLNNPLIYSDPTGESPAAACFAGPGAFFACVGAFTIGYVCGEFGQSVAEANKSGLEYQKEKAAAESCVDDITCTSEQGMQHSSNADDALAEHINNTIEATMNGAALPGTSTGGGLPSSKADLIGVGASTVINGAGSE